ncbi:MAG: hypothetical protein LBM02_02370 [Lachnospiraceae bacterium]|jgi:hypothetical protein|nr:hypothetical protein [Lachnospiraceae bacterium]
MKIVKCFYNSLVLSLAIGVILFNNVWLQMRVNIGTIFFAVFFLLLVIGSIFVIKKKINLHYFVTITITIISILVVFMILGFTRLQVVPAAFIREGLHLPSLSFQLINYTLIFILAALFLVISFADIRSGIFKK